MAEDINASFFQIPLHACTYSQENAFMHRECPHGNRFGRRSVASSPPSPQEASISFKSTSHNSTASRIQVMSDCGLIVCLSKPSEVTAVTPESTESDTHKPAVFCQVPLRLYSRKRILAHIHNQRYRFENFGHQVYHPFHKLMLQSQNYLFSGTVG